MRHKFVQVAAFDMLSLTSQLAAAVAEEDDEPPVERMRLRRAKKSAQQKVERHDFAKPKKKPAKKKPKAVKPTVVKKRPVPTSFEHPPEIVVTDEDMERVRRVLDLPMANTETATEGPKLAALQFETDPFATRYRRPKVG